MKLLVLFAVIKLISADFHSDLPCPERPVQQNFDIKKLAGRWFTVMQYEDSYLSSLTCSHGKYEIIDDNSLKVTDCAYNNAKYSCLTGIISLVDSNRVPSEGKTSYANFDNPSEKVDEFKYLSVDYDNYAIVYECKDKPDGKSIHSLWVSSRTPILNDNVKDVVNGYIDKYFNRNEIRHIEQSLEVCSPV